MLYFFRCFFLLRGGRKKCRRDAGPGEQVHLNWHFHVNSCCTFACIYCKSRMLQLDLFQSFSASLYDEESWGKAFSCLYLFKAGNLCHVFLHSHRLINSTNSTLLLLIQQNKWTGHQQHQQTLTPRHQVPTVHPDSSTSDQVQAVWVSSPHRGEETHR